ncbi:hypothetical protein [Dokdonella sp.]|uniref:hypothetical protein n=1 Tax=Dokdonella sp. TaxID=2291710 RepID=UPI0025BB0FC0|nr:hypothetical protein [Dokdonella sp.]
MAELDEDRTQFGECEYHRSPRGSWSICALARGTTQRAQRNTQKAMRVIDHFIQAVAHQHDGDAQQ